MVMTLMVNSIRGGILSWGIKLWVVRFCCLQMHAYILWLWVFEWGNPWTRGMSFFQISTYRHTNKLLTTSHWISWSAFLIFVCVCVGVGVAEGVVSANNVHDVVTNWRSNTNCYSQDQHLRNLVIWWNLQKKNCCKSS